MNESSASLGQVVQSKAGRDKKRFFLIVGFAEDAHVWIADGDLRKINRPKRKKMKHLTCKPMVDQDIMKRLDNHELVHDYEIRNAINRYEADIKGEQACRNKM